MCYSQTVELSFCLYFPVLLQYTYFPKEMMLVSMDIVSQSDYGQEEHENGSCSIQFKKSLFYFKTPESICDIIFILSYYIHLV